MAVLLEQIGAELSVVRAKAWHCDWNETLPFCRTEMSSNDVGYEPNPDDDLLHDVLMKGLFCGIHPPCPRASVREKLKTAGFRLWIVGGNPKW